MSLGWRLISIQNNLSSEKLNKCYLRTNLIKLNFWLDKQPTYIDHHNSHHHGRRQRDQIGRFISNWATLQSLRQQFLATFRGNF